MKITIERNPVTGAYKAQALVKDAYTPFTWYEHITYYGYRKAEIKALFKEHLARNGMKIVRDN